MKSHNAWQSNKTAAAIGFLLMALDALIFYGVVFARGASVARSYFFNAGKGDAELIVFPGNVKVLVDAGPSNAILGALSGVMPFGDTYIDLAIVSDPVPDEFGGYDALLDHYQVGAFLYNGRDGGPGTAGWEDLVQKIMAKNIPLITLGAGDKLHYAKNEIDLLSPNEDFAKSAAIGDAAFVALVKTPELRTLIAGTVATNVQNAVLQKGDDISATILKIPEDSQKDALGNAFLAAVNPKLIVAAPTATLEVYVNGAKLEVTQEN